MSIQPSKDSYGLISKLLHWLSAIIIIGLFASGKWMEDLDYYSEWYTAAPFWHKSIGLLLLSIALFRLFWKIRTPAPLPITSHSKYIQLASRITHYLIYLLLFIAMISGYLISTADGRGIEVFNLFLLPSIGEVFANQEDVAGEIHELATNGIILLAIIHALAALKHHFIDKDKTLSRMLN